MGLTELACVALIEGPFHTESFVNVKIKLITIRNEVTVHDQYWLKHNGYWSLTFKSRKFQSMRSLLINIFIRIMS